MKNKAYYEELFMSYPDVLTLRQFRSMLGGMCEKIALRIVKDSLVKHFVIRRAIYIPKVYTIEYVVSKSSASLISLFVTRFQSVKEKKLKLL